jgi:hypothetical protein
MANEVHSFVAQARRYSLECFGTPTRDWSGPEQGRIGWGGIEWGKLARGELREANLSGANLTKADLANADLGKADLANADRRGSKKGRVPEIFLLADHQRRRSSI